MQDSFCKTYPGAQVHVKDPSVLIHWEFGSLSQRSIKMWAAWIHSSVSVKHKMIYTQSQFVLLFASRMININDNNLMI